MRKLSAFSFSSRRTLVATSLLAFCMGLLFFPTFAFVHATNTPSSFSALVGSAPLWTRGAHVVGPHSQSDQMTVGVMLKATHQDQLQSLVKSLYSSSSPSYHKWLQPRTFNTLFGPSSTDIAAATSFLQQSGLQVSTQPAGPMMLFATGSTSQVAAAFHTQINDYTLTNGQTYYSNATNILLPSYLTSSVLGIYGLNGFSAFKPYSMIEHAGQPNAAPPGYGGGPLGSGLTPSQIASIYHANPVYWNLHDKGHGATLAVFELSGYLQSDIYKYTQNYGLPHVDINDRKVLGGAKDDTGAGEVELDIELQIALAPNANKFLVYQSPNTELGSLRNISRLRTIIRPMLLAPVGAFLVSTASHRS